MMPEISIRIDSLELHGIAAFDADQFSASLNRELSGLLATGGPSVRSVAVGAVAIQTPHDVDSVAVGQHVARAIYTHMQQGGI